MMVHTLAAAGRRRLIRLASNHMPTGFSAGQHHAEHGVRLRLRRPGGGDRRERSGPDRGPSPLQRWVRGRRSDPRTTGSTDSRLPTNGRSKRGSPRCPHLGPSDRRLGTATHGGGGKRLYRVGRGRPASFGRPRPAPNRELVGARLSSLRSGGRLRRSCSPRRRRKRLQTYRRCRQSQRPSLDCHHAGLYAPHGRSTAPSTQPPEVGSGFGKQQLAVGGCFV